MAARTTREAARQRMRAVFEAALEQVIPADEGRPLWGRTFGEWEDQADVFDQTVTTTLLEERAALKDSARSEREAPGHCPRCGSPRLYLQRGEPTNKTMQTPHGPVELGHQGMRCRACGRSFSPSAP